MVFCTYCGRSFARNEHLERHVLTRRLVPVPSLLQKLIFGACRHQSETVQVCDLLQLLHAMVSAHFLGVQCDQERRVVARKLLLISVFCSELVQKHYHSHTEKEIEAVRHLINPPILGRECGGIM